MSVLIVQIMLFLFKSVGRYFYSKEVSEFKTQLSELEDKRARLFADSADHVAISGALDSRNRWIAERKKSPTRYLATLENKKVPGVELKSFSATSGGGTLKVAAPSQMIAAKWLEDSFSQSPGSLKVEEVNAGKTIVSYSWTD